MTLDESQQLYDQLIEAFRKASEPHRQKLEASKQISTADLSVIVR